MLLQSFETNDPLSSIVSNTEDILEEEAEDILGVPRSVVVVDAGIAAAVVAAAGAAQRLEPIRSFDNWHWTDWPGPERAGQNQKTTWVLPVVAVGGNTVAPRTAPEVAPEAVEAILLLLQTVPTIPWRIAKHTWRIGNHMDLVAFQRHLAEAELPEVLLLGRPTNSCCTAAAHTKQLETGPEEADHQRTNPRTCSSTPADRIVRAEEPESDRPES